MSDLSIEAKAMIGAFWTLLPLNELSFDRPWIIHPRSRKGLDELVDKGFLTVEKFNDHSERLVWKPTDKMGTDKPKVSLKFLKENSFPLTEQ